MGLLMVLMMLICWQIMATEAISSSSVFQSSFQRIRIYNGVNSYDVGWQLPAGWTHCWLDNDWSGGAVGQPGARSGAIVMDVIGNLYAFDMSEFCVFPIGFDSTSSDRRFFVQVGTNGAQKVVVSSAKGSLGGIFYISTNETGWYSFALVGNDNSIGAVKVSRANKWRIYPSIGSPLVNITNC